MQGQIMLLVFGIIIACLLITLFVMNVEEKKPKRSKKKESCSFHRINEVEGILTVNGKKLKTYNIGELCLDKTITIRFFDGLYTDIRITDIFFNGKSLYSYAPAGDWKTKADFAISTLKSLANDQIIEESLVGETEEILLEVETLNKHIESGNLIRTSDEGFAWNF